MKKITAIIAGLMMVLSFSIGSAVFADENEVVALKSQISDLNDKVSSLERMVKTMEGHITPAEKTMKIVPPVEQEGGLIHTLQDIHMGGYIDTQYSMALNDATDHRTAVGDQVRPTNLGRVFDVTQDSFTVNAVELDFEKTANPEGGAGFRFDIMYGEDAEIVDSDATDDPIPTTVGGVNTGSGTEDDLDLQQAYVEYVQPLSFWEGNEILPHSINIKAGRFVTLSGAEVIEAKDNWNISRSFAFGLAIPFTHTGVRTNVKMFNDKADVYLGLNNGWDTRVDNNRGKTVEMGLGYSPIEKVNMFHSLYFGPENNDTIGHKRFLLSNVASFDVTDQLSLKGELNFGHQRRIVGADNQNAEWHSYAGYARYELSDKLAMAYRMELFRQNEFTRTALDETLFEQTVTAEYDIAPNLIGRFEYRWDKANNLDSFDLDSNQQTLGAQLIYNFA